MPSLPASQRAAGSWSPGQGPGGRHYGPDVLGGLCRSCRMPIPAALVDDTHPTCGDDWPELVADSRRATRRTNPNRKA